MNVFDIIAGTASILGLVISLIGLVVSGFTLYEVKKMDNSKTENSLKRTSIGGDFVGRDRK
jgi:hypothetical protein